MTAFDICFNYLILKDESSKYVNNPNDSGGPTRWGITKKTYADFFHRNIEDIPDSEIEQMPPTVAKQIYTALYWFPLSCDKILDLGFACALFDCEVLYGVGTIGIIMQKALISCGVAIKLDGHFGDRSAEALNGFVGGGDQNRRSLMRALQDQLIDRADEIIAAHPKDEVFRNGWIARTNRLDNLLFPGYLKQFEQELFT